MAQHVDPHGTPPPAQTAQLPFWQMWPAGQHTPDPHGVVADGHTQVPLKQAWPAGQQAVPQAVWPGPQVGGAKTPHNPARQV